MQLLESLLTQRLRQSTSTAVTGVKRHLRRRTTAYRSFAMPVRAKQNPSKHQLKRRRIPFEMRCRKHRRRPHVLYKMHDMYAEECQKGVRWLDTHIWHAKRMKMVRRWGFLLPERHAARGVRASTKVMERKNAAGAFCQCQYSQLLDVYVCDCATGTEASMRPARSFVLSGFAARRPASAIAAFATVHDGAGFNNRTCFGFSFLQCSLVVCSCALCLSRIPR